MANKAQGRRSKRHAGMYEAQFARTARNKAAYQTRIARRKAKRSPGRKACRARNRHRAQPQINPIQEAES